jgi:hypothetical protein
MSILPDADSPAAQKVRELARVGRLTEVYDQASPVSRSTLRRGVHEIADQVIFQRITIPVERQRRHDDCARGVPYLRPECLDRFHDAVEALVNDTLRRATVPILKLDAWMAAKATAATVDDHRARRGERGALQRPHVSLWLRRELADDPWLVDLALAIITWVGIPDTTGVDMWPVDAWADRRARVTGDHVSSDPATVRREVDVVLTAMRRRQGWYAKYVERPLERKPIAVAPTLRTWDGLPVEPAPLALVSADEQHDCALRDLAARCLDMIRVGFADPDADRGAVVVRAVGLAFRAQPPDLTRAPHGDPDPDVHEILSDPAAVARIVDVLLEILGEEDRSAGATRTHRRPAG